MSRGQLFLRLLLRAAWVRKDRALTALVSVAVVATIATVALTIYSDLEGKLSREFRGFGANVIVTSAMSLDAEKLATINKTLDSHGQVGPVAYAVATTQDKTPVVIGGTDIKMFRELKPAWSTRSGGYRSEERRVGRACRARWSPYH